MTLPTLVRVLYADPRMAHRDHVRRALECKPGRFALRQCITLDELQRQLAFGETDVVLGDACVLSLWFGDGGGRFDAMSPLPLVLLADRGCSLTAAEAMGRGASDYLLHPYQLGLLPAAIQSAVARHKFAGRCRLAGPLAPSSLERELDARDAELDVLRREIEGLAAALSLAKHRRHHGEGRARV
jgi:DNA-binding NtrC family response regulator